MRFFTTERSSTIIAFEVSNLPPKGVNYNKDLYWTVSYRYKHILITLVDYKLLKTAKNLSLTKEHMTPFTHRLRAYESKNYSAIGRIALNIAIELAKKKVTLQVIDIPTTFSLLLGQPWHYDLKAVPVTL